MTTIAYRDGVLACESRLSSDEGMIWHNKCKKIFRLNNGCLFGASGDLGPGEVLYQALQRGILNPSLPADSDILAILIDPRDGQIHFFEDIWNPWPEPFAAIGSGKAYAITALRLGYGAVEAVRAGIAGDCHSGGRIQTLKLKGWTK